MDWFRTDSDLPRHPQVLRLARTLGVSKVEAIGHLTCLWCAVAEHAEDGALDIADTELIELWAEWPESRRGHFVAAMQTVGWIDSGGMLKGWAERHEYMLRERKRKSDERRKWRESKDKRKRTVRAASDGRCAPSPPDGAPHRTVPDRTVPDSTSTTDLPPVGGLFGSPEKVAPKKPTTDQARVVEAYQGMFEERFGYPPAADKTKPFVQAANAIRALGGGATAADTLIGLLPRYFDLSETDKFFHGASFSKFVLGDTLNKLRAPSAVDRGQRILDEVFGPRNGDGE